MTERGAFVAKLRAAATKNNSLVCVGLDPELEKLPAHIRSLPQPILEFNRRIVDITSFDPNVLHIFSKQVLDMIRAGQPGWEALVPPYVDNMIKDNRLFGFKSIQEGAKA